LRVRRPAIVLAALAIAAALVVGIVQAGGGTEKTPPFDLRKARQQLAGSPAPLAALHARSSTIERNGTVKRYEAVLRSVKGYPVVVNGWGTWCGPCKLEFPLFQQVATKLGRQVAFLGLNVSDNNGEAVKYLRKRPVPYPSIEDGDTRIVQHLGWLGGLPITVFYNAAGRKFVHQGGYTKQADLVRDIRKYALA
jgi:thiol-disulfide isomerase/thioredoxin